MDIAATDTSALEQQMLMEALGIRHSRLDQYHYKDYRYTNLKDAIAQAQRDIAIKPD